MKKKLVFFHYLKAFELIISVHYQLRLVAIYSDQDHVLWAVLHIAAHQLVGGSIGEELREGKKSYQLHRCEAPLPICDCTAPWWSQNKASCRLQLCPGQHKQCTTQL